MADPAAFAGAAGRADPFHGARRAIAANGNNQRVTLSSYVDDLSHNGVAGSTAGLVPADLKPLDFAAEVFVVTRPLDG